MNKGKLIKNIAIIVLVPTVLVGAYYGGMYLHKQYKKKKEKDKAKNNNLNSTNDDTHIKMLPKDLPKIQSIVDGLNSEIKIVEKK